MLGTIDLIFLNKPLLFSGVTLKAGMPDNTKLETLGLDDDCTNKIITILENKFNISNISKTMVSQLTMAQ